MRRRCDDHQACGAVREIERKSQRQRATPGVADQDCAINAEPVEHIAQHRRLKGGRTALPALARAKAESWPIDQDHAVTRGQALTEREVHVFEIRSGAVKQDDRLHGLRTATLPKFDDMLAKAVDIDETAAWPMRPIDQLRADERHDCAGAKDRTTTTTTTTTVIIGSTVRGD